MPPSAAGAAASSALEDKTNEDNLTKNYSVSDENEEAKEDQQLSDPDATDNGGQPYPQGLISDDSNEIIILSPPRLGETQSGHEEGKKNSSGGNDFMSEQNNMDSMQIESINQAEDMIDQSYVQSSLDGGDIQTAKEDMFNISNIEEQNEFQDHAANVNKSVNLERKA